MQLKEKSRKSSRVQDRWIKRSNYKAIIIPDKTESKTGGLDSFHSESQWATQSTPNSLKDTVDHLHNLQQVKACFICGSRENSMDLIDCKRCHNFFVHSQCKLRQENRSPECDWTCENCMDKKSNRFIHHSSPIKKNSRIRAGLVPMKKLSDKPQKLGFKDEIFREESGVRLSNHGRTANELIKVPPRGIHSTSIPQNGIQVEKKLRRELLIDYSDIFDDDDYSAKKTNKLFQNAQYRHQTFELGTGTSSDKNRDSDDGKASSKIIKAPPENLQSTSFQHDGCAATTATRELPHVVRDRRQHFRRRNDSSPVKKRGQSQILQSLELMDQCLNGARHDVTGIKSDPVEKRLEYVPVEPIKNPVWQGHVRIQLGSLKTDIELCCYPSTKCSSKVAEAVKGLPNTITFDFKSRSDVWPRRFQMSPVNDEAIAVYFLPKNEKKRDVVAYDETFDRLVKYTFALLYEVPNMKQDLLIFPSSLLPVECQKLRRKYYMWGSLEEKGR